MLSLYIECFLQLCMFISNAFLYHVYEASLPELNSLQLCSSHPLRQVEGWGHDMQDRNKPFYEGIVKSKGNKNALACYYLLEYIIFLGS